MELGGNALLIALGLPLLVLFLVAVGQQARIRSLEKEIDDITLKFQVQAASPKEVRNELFAACPYPVCIVDTKGVIMARNQAFHRLTKEKVKSLTDFDTAARTTLHTVPLHSKRHSHRIITIKGESGHLRHFSVLLWPVWGPQVQVGTVLAFHEQTKVLERKSHQLQFERQLVTYLSLLAIQVEQLIQPAKKGLELEREKALNLLHGYTKEMKLLFAHLESVHGEIRQPKHLEVVNVVKLFRESLKTHSEPVKVKSLQLVSTLPKEALAVGHAQDISLALHSLINAAFLHAEPQSTVRIHVESNTWRVQVELTLPDLQLSDRDVANAFAFGDRGKNVPTMTRFWRLQLSIARELVSKYNGSIAVKSHDEFGTSYQLTLVASGKE